MTRKERDFITLRFRKKLDDDLREAVRNLEDVILSDLVRDGLRLMLGIRTTKKIEVKESVLSFPASSHDVNHGILAQGTKPTTIEPPYISTRESFQEPPTQQKAAKFPQKPSAPYLSNQNRRN